MQQSNTVELKNKIDNKVFSAMLHAGKGYWIALGISTICAVMGACLWIYMIFKGLGVAGLNIPVGWAVFITNFVFWVGIAHSGTLISAILYLFRAKFRSRFNRSAEAMTIIAIMTAGLFPMVHLGRVWVFYYLLPYPNQRHLWINFRSPLIWDVFAVSTYFTVSAIFFYVGLIPDLAIVRRCTTGFKKVIYTILSLGWIGTNNQWKHYNQLYLFLAAFATPLVLSVHSVVSWDFAMSILPGWHTTIFAPYFVAGAIFSGTAMVMTLIIPMRKFMDLKELITIKHMDMLARVLLLTSLIVTYSYIVECSLPFYSGNVFELAITKYRMFGPYKFLFWLMLLCNSVFPLTLFIGPLRRNIPYLFIISLFVNIGMWVERFVLIVTSLAHDFNPYSWGIYKPTYVEIGITIGSFGFFFMWFLLFVKALPVLAITEIKEECE